MAYNIKKFADRMAEKGNITKAQEFRISYEWNIGMYYLYTFGRGKLRKIPPDVFKSLEEAKAAAYEIYNNEMCQMKKAVDHLVVT